MEGSLIYFFNKTHNDMNRLFLILISISLFFSCNNSNKSKESDGDTIAKKPTTEWIYLFDGSSTEHWRAAHSEHFPDSGWYVSDGELMNDGTSKGSLISKQEYSNFVLEWEWRLFDEGGNSGLKYFLKEDFGEGKNQVLGLEYQMLDDERHAWMKEGKMKPNDYHTSGALYEFFPPLDAKKMAPLGEFNISRIVSDGNHVEHWLNGEKVVEYERGGEDFLKMKALSKFKDHPEFGLSEQGYLMLQDHSSRVSFRNIRIKILDDKNPK